MRCFALCLVLILAPGPCLAADLVTIQETLRELHTSVNSIRIEYVVEYPDSTFETVLLKEGNKLSLSQQSAELGARHKVYDGRFSFDVMPDPDDPEGRHRFAFKDDTIPGHFWGEHSPLRWWGHLVGMDNRPLWQLLDSAVITGESRFRGWDVIDIDLGVTADLPQGTESITCKLSVQHDFAPVLFRRKSVDKGTGRETTMDSTVTKFREVWHPLLQRNVWFPDEMTFHETVSVTVRSVELNPALPAGSFTPVMDENTTLRDQTKPIDLRQATRTDLVIPKPRDVSKLEPLENAIRAFPETTSISGLTFLGLGVVLLAGAAVAHLWLGRT